MKLINCNTWCPICMKDHDVVLVGPPDRFYVCHVCTQGFVLPAGHEEVCIHCGSTNLLDLVTAQQLKPREATKTAGKRWRVPLVCSGCQERFQGFIQKVEEGWLYVQCPQCGSLSVGMTSWNQQYREEMGVLKGPAAIVSVVFCISCYLKRGPKFLLPPEEAQLPDLDTKGDNVIDFAVFKERKEGSR